MTQQLEGTIVVLAPLHQVPPYATGQLHAVSEAPVVPEAVVAISDIRQLLCMLVPGAEELRQARSRYVFLLRVLIDADEILKIDVIAFWEY